MVKRILTGILLSVFAAITLADAVDVDDDAGLVTIKVTGSARGRADTVYIRLVASSIATEYGDALQRKGFKIGKLLNVTYAGDNMPYQDGFTTAAIIGRQMSETFLASAPDEVTVTGTLTVKYRLLD